MIRMLLIGTALTAVLSASAHAGGIPCNPAVQNWLNGSQDTCPPLASGGSGATVSVAPATTSAAPPPPPQIPSTTIVVSVEPAG